MTAPMLLGREPVASEWAKAFLAGLHDELAEALRVLEPHADALRTEWRRQLGAFVASADEANALAALKLDTEDPELRELDLDAVARGLEAQGQALATLGVPEEHVLGAVTLRFECALRLLWPERRRSAALATALARLAFVTRLCLSAGYTAARSLGRRSFDERERGRLSRDLHDEVGHQLVVLKLYLEMIGRDLERGETEESREKLDEARSLVGQTIQSVRRLILDLGPAVLEQLGLVAALRLYGRQFTARTGIEVSVRDTDVPERLAPSLETALYRVLQGALSNVVKHARATGVSVSLASLKNTVLVMVIEDDGVGFDTSLLHRAFGLDAMRERIEGLGGRFHLESQPARSGRPGRGTRIEIDVPLEAAP